ncbi:hypothetical protein BH09MYX1_BH09MYX1_53630 [soil metagenome]
MTHGRRAMSAILVGMTLTMALARCGSSQPLAGRCATDSDCGSGLYCVPTGDLRQTCSADCNIKSGDSCVKTFGPKAWCHVQGQCALDCSTDNDCPGTKCDQNGSPPHCLARAL